MSLDVAASRRLASMQESELRRSADRLRLQAEQSVAVAKDDLGRDALRLRAETVAHADDLAAEEAQLRAEEERLAEAAWRLEARIEAFRYRKEVLKAAYTAAEVSVAERSEERIWDTRDITEASRTAEDQTEALRARAQTLTDQAGTGGSKAIVPLDADLIQEQLDAVSREAAVEKELARIRGTDRAFLPESGRPLTRPKRLTGGSSWMSGSRQTSADRQVSRLLLVLPTVS